MIDMDALLAQKKQNHPDRVASDGSVQKSVEAKEFRNDLIDWHDRGKPESELAALKDREQELRDMDLY